MQVKLLRAIQEKAVRPIGGHDENPVDVRILSATHKDLARLVEQGQFRQDLFYRINVIELHVPPLRERREDVPQLAGAILEQLVADHDGGHVELQPAALKVLQDYAFPGNVRELENILERAVAMCEDNRIEVADLMLPNRPRPVAAEDDEAGTGASARAGSQPLDDYISSLEREAIVKALEESRYNKTAAAKKLGITFRALRYKLKKLGID
jgi:two-component system response regulator PilR (NtrC family)